MSKERRIYSHRAIVRKEIGSWPKKQQEFVTYLRRLSQGIEGIDFLANLLGVMPLALIYWSYGSGPILVPAALPKEYLMPWSFGCSLLIYSVTLALINRLVVKRLQRRWISELKQKMAADKELVEAYEKLDQLSFDPCWRIEVAARRLDKFL